MQRTIRSAWLADMTVWSHLAIAVPIALCAAGCRDFRPAEAGARLSADHIMSRPGTPLLTRAEIDARRFTSRTSYLARLQGTVRRNLTARIDAFGSLTFAGRGTALVFDPAAGPRGAVGPIITESLSIDTPFFDLPLAQIGSDYASYCTHPYLVGAFPPVRSRCNPFGRSTESLTTSRRSG